MNVPNAITRFRLITAPGLVLIAWTGRADWVAACLLFLQVTDWVDGPLARRTRTSSEFGARLDSWADLAMFSSLLGALVVLERPLLLSQWPWIVVAGASFAASVAYSLVRFGIVPAYHQWSAKASGPITMLAALMLLLTGAAWPVRLAAVAVTLANLEAILITRRLRFAGADIASVLVVRDVREPAGENRRWTRRRLVVGFGVLAVAVLGVWYVVIPYPVGLGEGDPGPTSLMRQRIREARANGDTLVVRREFVPLERISRNLQRAVVVAEDYRFREHHGVDWVSLAEEVRWAGDDDFSWTSLGDLRALAGALAYARDHRDELRGRSTITQQLAKNLYFGTDRSLARKAMEFVVVGRLERRLDKDRILELYLNAAEWGPGVFGAEEAARRYFGRSAADLTLAQAAALAATLPHPLTSNPAQNPGRMAWRRDLILSRLRGGPGQVPAPIPPPDPELVLPAGFSDGLAGDSTGPDQPVAPDSSVAPDLPSPADTMAPLQPSAPPDTTTTPSHDQRSPR